MPKPATRPAVQHDLQGDRSRLSQMPGVAVEEERVAFIHPLRFSLAKACRDGNVG